MSGRCGGSEQRGFRYGCIEPSAQYRSSKKFMGRRSPSARRVTVRVAMEKERERIIDMGWSLVVGATDRKEETRSRMKKTVAGARVGP